jgi:hypothetical protein
VVFVFERVVDVHAEDVIAVIVQFRIKFFRHAVYQMNEVGVFFNMLSPITIKKYGVGSAWKERRVATQYSLDGLRLGHRPHYVVFYFFA